MAKSQSHWMVNRVLFGNGHIYPKCATKKVSKIGVSKISWKYIFYKLPLIQIKVDLVQLSCLLT